MNVHWPWFHKPEPAPLDEIHRALNGQFIPTHKERERRANEASVRMQLGIIDTVLTPEQKAECISRASRCSIGMEG